MATNYATALQKGLVAALRADAGVTDLVGLRIYDEPPEGVTRPYVRIGNIDVVPLRTQARRAGDIDFSIEVHSRPDTAGRVEATEIAEAVDLALNEAEALVSVEGFEVVLLHWMTQTVGRDDDGESYLAIVAFRTLLDG